MTDAIVLRPWRDSDAATLIDIFAASSDLSKEYPAPVTTEVEALACLRVRLGSDSERKNFAIEVDGVPVGNVGVSKIEPHHGTAWISYFVSAGARGRGYATRAVTAAGHWALTELDLFRLELGYRTNNPASEKVARAAGFIVEGVERSRHRYGDERYDVRTCSRLATDPAPSVEGVTVHLA